MRIPTIPLFFSQLKLQCHILVTAIFAITVGTTQCLDKKPRPKRAEGSSIKWQEWRGSNPQPPVLETGALPIELHSYRSGQKLSCQTISSFVLKAFYLMTEATTPAPTVRPPSRIAKRKPSSIAIGAINVTVIAILSPGITISVPSGNTTDPVTSVVRK